MKRRERTSGEPTSSNGASSFHLFWESTERLVEVAATVEVLLPPVVDRLYFWALQVSFGRGGAGHLGLQWNPRHPGQGAVNWGGYSPNGTILAGSESPLPSARNDLNTRDYPWQPLRPYRLRIFPSPDREGAWRGEVTDVATGESTVVRDLDGGGDYLTAPVVWSEVFARCEHPSVSVRWSDLAGRRRDGSPVRPSRLRVNYQSHARGGCANTSVEVDHAGVVQVTNTPRTTAHGTRLVLPI